MLKTRIILGVVAIAVIGLMFMLPKAVVENDSQLKEEASTAAPSQGHTETPKEITEAIIQLKAQMGNSSSNQKNAIFADSLRNLYSQAGKFDSAAWYAEQAASFFNTTESFIKAGNAYYEAYTFAMGQDKQNQMAQKAQEWFGKVLQANPKNLEVKSKLAMTYVSSKSPMQGIALLREVLQEDPKNEFALFNMGMLSIQSGQNDKAVDWMSQLVEHYPSHVQGNLLLGVAYLNKGNKEKARAQFEKVKQLDKDPAVQATVDSYLKDLN